MTTTETRPRKGILRYKFGDIAEIQVRKSVNRELRYKGWIGVDTRQIYGLKDLKNAQQEIQEGRIKPIRWKRDVRLDLIITMRDGTHLPRVTILERELPGLFKGALQRDGFSRTYTYEWGGLTIIEFDTDGQGTYLKHELEIPVEVLRSAIHRSLRKAHDFRHDTTTRFPITERHLRFYQPYAIVQFHGDAEEVYTKHQDDKAGGGQTLKDLINGLVQTAKNASRNKLDPVTLNLAREDEQSFYFWFTDKDGKRRMFNGGVIFHRSSGEYSTHT